LIIIIKPDTMKKILLLLLSFITINIISAQGVTKNGQISNTVSYYVNKNGAIGITGLSGNGQLINLPTITTTAVSAIDSTKAGSGGNIISDGGAAVTARGVCWSTSVNPTIASSITSDNSGAGIFTSTLTGLTDGTIYYVRAYATNVIGTAYGNEVSFTKITPLVVGQHNQGGVIGYILQPGNPGYVEGEQHGLIVANANQSTNAPWGCSGTLIGGTSSGLGSGQANTTAILSACSTAGTAAKVCDDYLVTVGSITYSDWYLPSYDELAILYANKVAIGGFANAYYWSSSESSDNTACRKFFLYGNRYCNKPKTDGLYVRAVRSF
jgi:hypothetical protein